MRTRPRAVFVFALLFFSGGYFPGVEANRMGRVLAENVSLDSKVLFLDTRQIGKLFTVGWIDIDGRAWEKKHISRKGRHGYEMRGHPGWKGEALSVSVMGIDFLSGSVAVPRFDGEMDILWAPEPWLRSSVNALWGHTFFGFSLERVLLFLMGFVAVSIFIVKRRVKTPAFCLLCGFVASMVCVEILSTSGHIGTARSIDENESMRQTKGLGEFSKKLATRIGDDFWGYENLPSIAAINIAYGLAEKKFAPASALGLPRYVISYENGGIVLLPPRK
ncbi:MAG: hypothetical protein ACE5FU_00605 [Nitrospinota bacterium]